MSITAISEKSTEQGTEQDLQVSTTPIKHIPETLKQNTGHRSISSLLLKLLLLSILFFICYTDLLPF